MLDLKDESRPEAAAAWLRLAQGVAMADRVAAPVESEITVQFSRTLLQISGLELQQARQDSLDLSIPAAVDVIRELEPHVRRLVLLGLVNVAFSDHEFKVAENHLIARIAFGLQLDASDLVDAFIAARRLMDHSGRPIDGEQGLIVGAAE